MPFGRGRNLMFEDLLLMGLMGGTSRYGGYGGFGDVYGGYGRYDDLDEIPYSSFNSVSDKALAAGSTRIFFEHLATVDVSKGSVTTEIIDFHLVTAITTSFRKFVKEHGCTIKQRKLTREEQDKINKCRQSLMNRTSVTVTREAQKKYLDAHPEAAAKAQQKSDAGANPAHATAARAPLNNVYANIPATSAAIMAGRQSTGPEKSKAMESAVGSAKKRKSM